MRDGSEGEAFKPGLISCPSVGLPLTAAVFGLPSAPPDRGLSLPPVSFSLLAELFPSSVVSHRA